MVRVVTDQRRADIYEQLLISEDKCVIDREDLKRLRSLWHKRVYAYGTHLEDQWLDRIDAAIERRQERTT